MIERVLRSCGRATVCAAIVAATTRAPLRDARAADDVVVVESIDALRDALAASKPGARIRVAPGTYPGGIHVVGPRGTAQRPVVVEAADAAKPPLFRGGTTGIHLSGAQHVELRDLAFEGQTGNGLNLDDGGTAPAPSHHVVLHGLTVRDVGPDGNCDGIKLSGIVDFRVERCTVVRWGRAGSAVDMVGCRRGAIERCTFAHGPDAARASGVQCKGGSREITVRRNRFEHAGARAVNAGGSTGLAYFRPALDSWTLPRFEAKDVVVEGNVFVGGETSIAFVGVDGATFRFNTVHVPGRWAMRILQETRETGFVPSRGGVVSDNVFLFRSDRWSEGGVNVGTGTDPASFRFERNVWFCVDAPTRTKDLVRVPVPEVDGIHGKDPRVPNATEPTAMRRDGETSKAGADALPR